MQWSRAGCRNDRPVLVDRFPATLDAVNRLPAEIQQGGL
jgi:hypothetical protein